MAPELTIEERVERAKDCIGFARPWLEAADILITGGDSLPDVIEVARKLRDTTNDANELVGKLLRDIAD